MHGSMERLGGTGREASSRRIALEIVLADISRQICDQSPRTVSDCLKAEARGFLRNPHKIVPSLYPDWFFGCPEPDLEELILRCRMLVRMGREAPHQLRTNLWAVRGAELALRVMRRRSASLEVA